MDITEAVKRDLDARTQRGLSKYGVALEHAGLSEYEMLKHAYEEALDLAQYLRTRMAQIEAGTEKEEG